MNKQYQELQVQDSVYIPQPAMDYPQENPFERTLFPKHVKDIVFDEHYPYLGLLPHCAFLFAHQAPFADGLAYQG